MAPKDETAAAAALLREQRWAALASLGRDGRPLASMVAYALEPDLSALYLHLSRLAAHTGNLLAAPEASLAVSEPDPGNGDPQTLARITVGGRVEEVARGGEDYRRGRHLYLKRLPDAEPLFEFTDFVLFRLVPDEARFVGGFGRAVTLSAAELRRQGATEGMPPRL